MLNLAALLLRARAAAGARARRAGNRQVELQQAHLLRSLLAAHASSQFGREHGLAQVTDVQAFRQEVPVRDYEGHRPYIDRIIAGQASVLTAEPVLKFNLTSGTTRQPKLVPVTQAMEAQTHAITRQWLGGVAWDHPRAFQGAFLGMVSPETEGFAGKLPFGSTSGSMVKRAPWVMRRRFAVPYEVCEVKDYQQRYFLTLRFAAERGDISHIATPNPSTLLRLEQILLQEAENLVRAIHDGTLGLASDQAEAVALAARLRPNPQRARVVERHLADPTPSALGAIWPHVAVVGCWLGGSVGLHLPRLRTLFGPQTALRDLGYLASEGRLSLPMRDLTASGELALSGNFFEFTPEDCPPAAGCQTLLAHELELGKRYYVLITHAGGLYRYDINDIVEVTGFTQQCPEVAFLRKGRDMASITGEKLHVNQCLAALLETCNLLAPAQLIQCRLWPNVGAAHYELALELSKGGPVTPAQAQAFITAFDSRLRQENIEYDGKRASGRLHGPRLHLMRRGWYEARRADALRQGKRDIQFKWTVLLHQVDPADQAFIEQSIEPRTESAP